MMNLHEPFNQLKHFSGFKPSSSFYKPEDLSGFSVIVSYKEHNNETGFSCFVKNNQNLNGKFGYSYEIVSLLQDILNFRCRRHYCTHVPIYNFTFVSYKSLDDINSYTFSSDAEGAADMVICHPSLDNIPDNVQLLLPTLHSRLVIVYQTSGLPLEKDLFLRNTAGGHMWLYLFGVSILLALCFRLSTHLHHRLQPRHSDWSWLEVVMWTFGAVCQQGSAKQPQGCSCRTMFVVGYLITNMIFTGFAAGITSLLAIRSEPTSLKWHLAVRMNVPFTVVCNSGADRYLKNLEEGQAGRKFKCVPTLEELVRQVEHTATAGVLSETSLKYHYAMLHRRGNEDVQCNLAIARQAHHHHLSGFVVKRQSPLINPFNYWLLRFKEHGILQRMLKRTISRLPGCQLPPGYSQVSFEHVKSPFLIISGNIIMSLLILCIEILISKYNLLLKQKVTNENNYQRFATMYSNRQMKFIKVDLRGRT